MADEPTTQSFNNAANPSPPGNEPGTADAPPSTPSQQVTNHQLGLNDGPPPPGSVGQTVKREMHNEARQADGARSDQANHYTRNHSPQTVQSIKSVADRIFAQAKQAEREKAKNKTQNKDRERDD